MQPFAIEHILPREAGGPTVLDNLAWSCQGCNGHKHTKTHAVDPVSHEVVPLYHPRQHRWQEHFAWSADYELVVGLTPTGRATVEALHLNREGVVNLRRALYAFGKHPPGE
jgi:5-methylcytosine-specific restriction endonuclease McrA